MTARPSTPAAAFQIRSRASGPHWIAWLVEGDDEKPVGSVILVGQTREDAEDRARTWAEQLAAGAAVPPRRSRTTT